MLLEYEELKKVPGPQYRKIIFAIILPFTIWAHVSLTLFTNAEYFQSISENLSYGFLSVSLIPGVLIWWLGLKLPLVSNYVFLVGGLAHFVVSIFAAAMVVDLLIYGRKHRRFGICGTWKVILSLVAWLAFIPVPKSLMFGCLFGNYVRF